MKLKRLVCPYCNGNLDVDISGKDFIHCPYCRSKLEIDRDGKVWYKTVNKNINKNIEENVNKNITINKNIHKRYTNDAEVIRAKSEFSMDRIRLHFIRLCVIIVIIPVLYGFGLMGYYTYKDIHDEKIAKAEGKVSVGFYRDLIGKDYKVVKADLESAGFTNIELIDLNDSGVFLWKKDKIESISIGGNSTFDSGDYFDLDTKIIISYH